MEEYATIRLKAQEEKHKEEKENLKKIFESASYGCWDYLPKHNSWTNFDSGQTATTTELIEMFKKSNERIDKKID
jgi:hypothetical protein